MSDLYDDADWWQQAVVYQVYPRSFADSNGDGLGDIAGVASRMDYLAELGIDAIWLSPFYPSELADGGYDVIDYRAVDPHLGTIGDFDRMVAAAHAARIKVIVDIVPNHTSNKHAWFQAALAAGRGSAERERYIFREGAGEHGELPPNNWQSIFGGPAWERVEDGQWYLHMFAPEQPDLNWKNPEVGDDFERTLRFWSDRGVDGFRIDVAHALAKDLDSRPLSELEGYSPCSQICRDGTNPLWDRPEVHEIYRRWRRVFNEYEPPRFAVGEAWVCPEHQHLYASPDELGQVFNFEFAKANWDAGEFRLAIEEGLDQARRAGSTTTWVMSNHDVVRHATRFALPQVKGVNYHQFATDWVLRGGRSYPEDRELGARRARAAILMELALPGSVYVYQGEELGLFEVPNIPWDMLEDPQSRNTFRSGINKGRDGCRVPLPWSAADVPAPAAWDAGFGDGMTGSFGFSGAGEAAGAVSGCDAAAAGKAAAHAAPHLPQPLWFRDFCVDAEEKDPASMLALYRRALAARRGLLSGGGPSAFAWQDGYADDVIAYHRACADGRELVCVVNFGDAAVALPDGEVLLASGKLEGGALGRDQAAWVIVK